ncbi:MAG: STAS domain-containing protein [Aquihabitans sp.]
MDQTIEPIDLISAEPGAPAVVEDPRLHARPVVAERRGDDLTLYVSGALSMNVSEEVARQALFDIGEGAAMVTVDLAGVTFIDSTGIRALIEMHRRVTETGGRMVITRPHEAARHMLTLVRLDTVIPIGPAYDPETDEILTAPADEDEQAVS